MTPPSIDSGKNDAARDATCGPEIHSLALQGTCRITADDYVIGFELAADLVHAVITDTKFLDFFDISKAGGVMYFEGFENSDDLAGVVGRAEYLEHARPASTYHGPFLKFPSSCNVCGPAGLKWLEENIMGYEVALCTLGRAHSSFWNALIDESKGSAGAVQSALNAYRACGQATGCTMAIVTIRGASFDGPGVAEATRDWADQTIDLDHLDVLPNRRELFALTISEGASVREYQVEVERRGATRHDGGKWITKVEPVSGN